MKYPWIEEIEKLRAENKELLAVCEAAIEQVPKAQQIMRDNDFVIGDLDDRWQKLVFTFYNLIVDAATEAEDVCARRKEKR